MVEGEWIWTKTGERITQGFWHPGNPDNDNGNYLWLKLDDISNMSPKRTLTVTSRFFLALNNLSMSNLLGKMSFEQAPRGKYKKSITHEKGGYHGRFPALCVIS